MIDFPLITQCGYFSWVWSWCWNIAAKICDKIYLNIYIESGSPALQADSSPSEPPGKHPFPLHQKNKAWRIPGTEEPSGLLSMGSQRVGHDWSDLAAAAAAVCVRAKSLQSCPTLWDPMDCKPPGSSVHGILQAKILEWVAISFSRGSSWLRDQSLVSSIPCIRSRVLYHYHHLGSPSVYIHTYIWRESEQIWPNIKLSSKMTFKLLTILLHLLSMFFLFSFSYGVYNY